MTLKGLLRAAGEGHLLGLLATARGPAWCPGQAFVGVQVETSRRSPSAGSNAAAHRPLPSPSSAPLRRSGLRSSARMSTSQYDAVTSTSSAPAKASTELCSAETTYQGESRVIHIATPGVPPPWMEAEEDEEDQATIAELVSHFGAVSEERGVELVKFGSVYIGEVVDTSWKHPPSKEKQATVAAAKKRAAKSADQAPFRGTSFEHMKLRRLNPWEAKALPPHGAYLRVHCDPRTFQVSQSTDWSKRIVFKNEDFVVVDKPAGVPTVPTIDNGVQNCVFQAGLAVAGLTAESRSLPPPLHAVSRLDVCTSGIVVFARHKAAAKELNGLFRDRKVKKRYLALLAPGPPVPLGPAAHCCRSKAFDGSRRPRIYAEYDEELLVGDKWGGAWQEARSTVLLCAPAPGAAAAAAVDADRRATEAAARALEESAAGIAMRLEAELAEGLGLGLGVSAGEAEGASMGTGSEGAHANEEAAAEEGSSTSGAEVVGASGADHVPHLCAMELETGRTHQLRLQLAAMGAAIVGDTRYRSVVGRVHRGLSADDDNSKFGQEPEAIALQAARIEFEWRGSTVVFSTDRPSWAL